MTGSVSLSRSRFADMISMPNAEVAGIIRLSLVIMTILLFRPNAFGMDGPVMSASRIAVCLPLLFIFTAIMAVTRDLPTPPLPLTTPITFLTLLAGFNGSKKLVCSAVRLLQDSPQVLQLWVQFSLM